MEKEKVYDYGQVLTSMGEKLALLADHIEEHQLHDGWDYDAQRIRTCIRLIDKFLDSTGMPDQRTWNLLWRYISFYMQGWWC